MDGALIELRQVELVFGRVRVLGPLDLDVPAREMLAVVGPSGSGKTSLLNLIGGLEKPTAGTVRVEGEDLGSLGDVALSEYRCRKVGFVFQSFHLQTERTVLQNLLIPLYFSGADLRDGRKWARELLTDLGLEEFIDVRASSLSGGQRQRVAFARALMNRPSLLLADEPVGNLDKVSAELVLNLLLKHNAAGLTIVLATHDQLLLQAVHRTVAMDEGKLCA